MSITIYDLDIKDMRKALAAFHKTLYGRTVFLFAYFIPFTSFVSAAIMLIIGSFMRVNELILIAGIILLSFIVTFVIGNAYFYNELRKFVASGKFKK